MPARPWKDRSNNTAANLRSRIKYLRQSNDDLRGELAKVVQENMELKERLQELQEQGKRVSSPIGES